MATNKNSLGTTTSFLVTKRATPTLTLYGNNSGYWAYQSPANTTVTFAASGIVGAGGATTTNFTYTQQAVDAVAIFIKGHWTASAEL